METASRRWRDLVARGRRLDSGVQYDATRYEYYLKQEIYNQQQDIALLGDGVVVTNEYH